MSITNSRLAELLRKHRESLPPIPTPQQERKQLVTELTNKIIPENQQDEVTFITYPPTPIQDDIITGIGRDGSVITYNTEQLEFIRTASSGISCILIGAAGTGKTTCMRGTIEKLIQNGNAGIMNAIHKYLPESSVPGIVAVSFTRRAVSNLRRAMPKDMVGNCITIHKLLEYEPVYYDIMDEKTGETKTTMKFMATRHEHRKLPEGIHTIIIDESSMVSVELFKEILNAVSPTTQFIFLGDIQQLPPVFGSAILGYKMLELKTIELTQVYRQALESPIIRLAHRILSGKPILESEYPAWKFEPALTIHAWKRKFEIEHYNGLAAAFFTSKIESGEYNPEEDMILIPQNVGFGSIELNKYIANHLAIQRKTMVYEIMGGIQKVYLSVGDKILYDREDSIITDIKPNPLYFGTSPQPASLTLDYWGHEQGNGEKKLKHDDMTEADIDAFLDAVQNPEDSDKVRKASHIITIKMLDSEKEIKLDTAGHLNSILLSYALTVHKAQGSEWRKVFFITCWYHSKMIQRELLYTAVTRAKEELYVICEAETFKKGILSQKIKGNTLAEKAEYFKGKLELNGGY